MPLRPVLLFASALIVSATAAQTVVPTGSTIGRSGLASILDVPPAPFTPRATGTTLPTAEQIEGQRQFARSAKIQGDLLGLTGTLRRVLEEEQKGNFVDFYFEHEGEPRFIFRFLRNGPETLAKYLTHPRIKAETVRFSQAELEAAMDHMLKSFREDRIIMGGGTGTKRNRAEVEIGITEPEFRALVARKGVKIPEAVHLEFVAKQPASVINAKLQPPIASLVRIFARQDRPLGALPDIASHARIVLKDGCFRMPEQDNAHVAFPLGATLFIDRQGYLAFGPDKPGYARVGETVTFHGTIPEARDEKALVAAVHAACGPGKVVKISAPTSAAAERIQRVLDENVWALRSFKESYGLSDAQARHALEACKVRSGGEICLTTPAPPPDPRGTSCPAGTKLSFGLCRTKEGYIRPIPKWVTELIAE